MKRVTLLITTMLLLTCGAAAQSGYDLYQKALVKERAVGNVEEALRLYQQIVKEFGGNHALAAKAQLRLGLLYERLGRKAEAQRAFQSLVNQYADQREAAAQARARLAALSPAAGNETANKAVRGPTVRQVWEGSEVDVEGAVSPDGQYLTYVDWETGDLAVREIVSGKKRRLTNKGTWDQSRELALFSTISPDSKRVAYNWFNKDSQWELRTIGSDGSAPRVLYRSEAVEYVQPADWSPDGKYILAGFTKRDRNNQIVLVAVADGSVRTLKTLDRRFPERAAFSPDGRSIAYDFQQKENKPERDISLLATDGSREIALIQHAANDLCPVWTPDGKRVIFASNRTGAMSLWAIDISEGKPQGAPERIRAEVGQRFRPLGFTRGGDYFYGLGAGNGDVYLCEVDFLAGKLLSPPSLISERFMGDNGGPSWSPDGQYLAYRSQRKLGVSQQNSSVLVIRSVRTGEERELFPALSAFFGSRWSPDGRFFLTFGQDNNARNGLHRVDVQTGEVTPLVQSEFEIQNSSFGLSPDGKAIFYSVFDSNTKGSRLLTRDLATGQERELHRGVFGTFTLSPDGKQLAFREVHQPTRSTSLKVMPATGGVPRELLSVKEPEFIRGNNVAWTADGTQLLFVKGSSNEQKNEVWRISASGGEAQKIGLSMTALRNMQVHPDGRRIAFVAGDSKAEVWVMENFLSAAQAQKASVSRR